MRQSIFQSRHIFAAIWRAFWRIFMLSLIKSEPFLSSSFSVYELYSWKKNLAHNVVKNALYLTKVSRDGPNHLSNCFFATLTHCYKIIFLVRFFFLFRFVLKKVELELYCFPDNNTGYRKRLNFRAKHVSTYFEQENKCSISVFTTIKLQEKGTIVLSRRSLNGVPIGPEGHF